MPISSGAAGRAGANSYLERYLENLPKERRKDILDTLVGAHQNQSCISGPTGDSMDVLSKELTGETAQHRRRSREGDEFGRQSVKDGSKKSHTCAIL